MVIREEHRRRLAVLAVGWALAFAIIPSVGHGGLPKAIYLDWNNTYAGLYVRHYPFTQYQRPQGGHYIDWVNYRWRVRYNDGLEYVYVAWQTEYGDRYYITEPIPWEMIATGQGKPPPRVAVMERSEPLNPQADAALTKEPVNTISGNMVHDDVDIVLNGPGVNLIFARNYISGSAYTNSPIGALWTHSYDWAVSETSEVVTVASRQFENDVLRVRTGDGRFVSLTSYETSDAWESYKDTSWRATKDANGYSLETELGLTYRFDLNGVLKSLTDPWDSAVFLSYSNSYPNQLLTKVEHTNGLYLAFEYVGNRITAAKTPSANLSVAYAYDAGGNLTNAVRTTADRVTSQRYAYSGHSLTRTVDAGGDTFFYGYATNSLGSATSLCTNMVLGPQYYRHSLSYHTNQSYTAVNYSRGATNQLYEYHYDTNLMRIVRLCGPGNTNTFTSWSYDKWYVNATNVYSRDAESGDFSRVSRDFDDRHNVIGEAYGYCANPTNEWKYVWHEDFSLPRFIVDPENHVTEMEYVENRLAKFKTYYSVTHSHDSRFGYTVDGLLSVVTNANGHWTRFSYDGYGRLAGVQPQAGPSVTLSNNVLGYVEGITLPGAGGSRVTRCYPDELGRLRRIIYPDSLDERFEFDALGNVTNHIDRAGRATRYAWLPTRKLASVSRTLTGTSNQTLSVAFDYDQQFNTLEIRDEKDRRVESYRLDLQDRPAAVTNLEGQTMTVDWGLGEKIRRVTRFDGTVVSNAFDAAGRLSKVIVPEATNTFTYLKNDLLRTAVNRAGTVSNSWSYANRLAASVSAAPSGRVDYVYWPAGQVSNVTSVAGSTRYTHDAAERLSRLQSAAGTFDALYNPTNGLVASVTCTNTGLSVAYGYDTMDRLTNIVWRTTGGDTLRQFGYRFDNAGMVSNVVNEAGERRQYTYDSLYRLTGEQCSGDGSDMWSAAYQFDEAGNRTQKTLDGVTVDYTCATNGNRLLAWSADLSGGGPLVDVFGRSSEPIGTNVWLGQRWVSNTVVRTPGVSGTNFWAWRFPLYAGTQGIVAAVSDAAGNVGYASNTVIVTALTNGVCEYSAAGCVTNMLFSGGGVNRRLGLRWDGEYRLTAALTNGALAETHGYDALGRRAWTAQSGVTNWFVYDGVHVVAEVDAQGHRQKTYTWGPGIDNLVAFTAYTSGQTNTYYALTDHLGTVHAFADADGEIVESYRFDAWGRVLGVYDASNQPIGDSAIGNRYLWQGREYSWKVGVYYFRARWYDPVTGRFLSNDPIGVAGGLNQYVFAGNNPVNFRDPFGLCTDDNYPSLSQWHWYDSVYSYLWQTGRNAVNYFGAPWINTYNAAGAYYDNPTLVNGCYLAQSYLPVVIGAGMAGLGSGSQTIVHYTSQEGAAAITQSGSLNAGTYVTVPGQVTGMGAAQVEAALEIQAGRGAVSITTRTTAGNLVTPANGPVTSGGAVQYQIVRPVPVGSATFTPTPP